MMGSGHIKSSFLHQITCIEPVLLSFLFYRTTSGKQDIISSTKITKFNYNNLNRNVKDIFRWLVKTSGHVKLSTKYCTSCCDTGQNDTIGKIELNPSFVLSSKSANSRNDIQ